MTGSMSRTLKTRADYSLQAVVLGKTSDEELADLRVEVWVLGQSGYYQPAATMFKGTPLLRSYMRAVTFREQLDDELAEMANCPHCSDLTDHYPCPTHG